jgi:hypothetical protein
LEWRDIDSLVKQERASGQERSTGVHLSGVIRYVLSTAGLLTVEDATDEMPLRMAVGMAWEAFVVGLWPEIVWQPGEVHLDGVFGSPDGVTPPSEQGGIMCLEEFKATWKSRLQKSEERGVRPPPKVITEDRLWMLQLAGYCWMMALNRARLHVLWINGDYRQSGPQYFTYLIEFSEEELQRLWTKMIVPNIGKAKPEEH